MSDAERLKRSDAQSYDEVAEAFARTTRAVSEPIAQRMIEWAELAPGARVLDVGTGTGVVATAAARRVGAGGSVIGIDHSDGMLAIARAEAERERLCPPLAFQVGDAEALPTSDASIDCVLSLFALLHFPRPEKALAEMVRVAKPGGAIVVGIGGGPPLASRHALGHALRRLPSVWARRSGRHLAAPGYLEALVERVLPAAGPETLGKHHQRALPTRALVPLCRSAGFREIRTHCYAARLEIATPDAYWDLQRVVSSRVRARIQAASGTARAELERAFREGCQRVLDRGGQLTYPYAAFVVCGRRGFV